VRPQSHSTSTWAYGPVVTERTVPVAPAGMGSGQSLLYRVMRFEETKPGESPQVPDIVGLAREAHPSTHPRAPEDYPGALEWAIANLAKLRASPERSGALRLDRGQTSNSRSERLYMR
jgi:hypothetical protein